jgi:chromate transporter
MTDADRAEPIPPIPPVRRPGEVLAAFAKLGVTSFGGPIAHLGYFRAELVEKRRWVTEKDYADLVALCQFLPGPASSQVGFALGLARGGVLGALAAFAAFTLPSAVLLVAFAFGASAFDGPIAAAILSGLKVVAVAIVAQAVLGMARTLTPDARRALIAAAAAVLALLLPGSWGQIGAIVLGALAGILFCRADDGVAPGGLRFRVPRAVGVVALALFAVLLLGAPVLGAITRWSGIAVFDAFFRSGALVFGGGHVVLPLLQGAVVDGGWVGQGAFLTGYGAAQAVPGPLFTFAGYLGAILHTSPTGIAGAAVALVGIFLPGFLLLVGVLPFWDALRARRGVRSVMRGANAAVVGILAAALYTPVFTTAITGVTTFALALVCFALLVAARLPPWAVVLVGAAGGLLIAALSGRLV